MHNYKHKLKYVEFYITNVCNLNCNNCNRFNNFAFSGHELWSTYKEAYQRWSQILDFDSIAILGGEPLLNPEFLEWVHGVGSLWPNAKFSIVTNGTQLNRWADLYQILEDNKHRMFLELTLHGQTLKKEILDQLESFLRPPIQKIFSSLDFPVHEWACTWNRIKDPSWPECPQIEDLPKMPEHIQKECLELHDLGHYRLIDKNGVTVIVSNNAEFFNSAIKFDGDKMTLHASDPLKSVDVCISKFCHHFSQGKLFKCGVTGILPEFLKQFPLELSDEDRQLVYAYSPANIDWSDQQLSAFILNLEQGAAVDQCRFCTESTDTFVFEASVKKPKVIKLRPQP